MRTTFLALAALLVMALALPAGAQPTFTQDSDRVFLRGEGCGATEDLYLSLKTGPDGYDGCGTIGGLPVNELLEVEDSLSLRDTYTGIIDASRNLTAQIRAESWIGNGIPGAGNSRVTITVRAQKAEGSGSVLLGSATSEKLTVGADNATHTFDIDIADSAQGVKVKGYSLTVSVRGENVNLNNLGMEGDSFFDVPTLVEDL